MRNTFNNQVQKVRDGVNDLFQNNRNPHASNVPSGAPPTFYHLPSNASPADPYSHTANSTAGYSQANAYPSLVAYNQPPERQV